MIAVRMSVKVDQRMWGLTVLMIQMVLLQF